MKHDDMQRKCGGEKKHRFLDIENYPLSRVMELLAKCQEQDFDDCFQRLRKQELGLLDL